MKKHSIVTALENAVTGLVYVSETESALEPVIWDKDAIGEKDVFAEAGAPAGTAVETITLDDFFRTVSKADKPKFEPLRKILTSELSGTKGWKIGDEPEKTVVILGKTQDGKCAGVKTTVVET